MGVLEDQGWEPLIYWYRCSLSWMEEPMKASVLCPKASFSSHLQTPCCATAAPNQACVCLLELASHVPEGSISQWPHSSNVYPAVRAFTPSTFVRPLTFVFKDPPSSIWYISTFLWFLDSVLRCVYLWPYLCFRPISFTGSPVCQSCPRGSYSNATASDSCRSCSPGIYLQKHTCMHVDCV